MDAGFIKRSMENKTILITGSTGFLGKIFIEEVLRVQPQVNKLYLLLRAQDNTSAIKRFQQEVIENDVFRVLREQQGEGFDKFISSKVVAFAGDTSLKNLGIKNFELEQKMLKEIDFIVNVAAITKFDERYDVSLSINTLGPKHVCEFSNKCPKLELLLHISSAFVARGTEGVLFETPLKMGDILNKNSKTLNIELELKIAQERLKQLCELEEATDQIVTMSMKELGTQRARFHGWANSYQLTKAMGEMLLGELREKNVPLVIIRPSMITSTWKQPFPGWIEGFKNIDALVHMYGKGELTHFLADPCSIMDVIPVDMVVNAMIVAMAAHRRSCIHLHLHFLPPPTPPQEDGIFIYHVSSSSRNPIKYTHLSNWAYDYFSKNPWLDRNGVPIKVPRWTLLPSMASFSKYITLLYKLPSMALLAVKDSSLNNSIVFEDVYSKLDGKYMFLNRLSEFTGPFLLFRGIFDNSNMVKLGAALVKEETSEGDDNKFCFAFDAKHIDWEDYFKNVHFPGITKYVFIIRSTIRSSRLVSESKL